MLMMQVHTGGTVQTQATLLTVRQQVLLGPGYKMQVENAENNIFYLDLPTDVPNLDFNNYLNGGLRTEEPATGKVTYEFSEEQFNGC